VGNDFRFGHKATGDVTTLQRFGTMHDFAVVPHGLLASAGEAVTSTRIRRLIGAGQIALATDLLGKHPSVSGVVHRGRGEGASIGFPTANVVPEHYAAMPPDGVYAGRAHLPNGATWAAAISVGKPPMFPDAKDRLEAHLITFDGDLYDQPVTLTFWDRIREQRRFDSVESLSAAIAEDVDEALEIAGFTTEELQASAT
jgi:riboflavin kinase/FMN adenylyltransferase